MTAGALQRGAQGVVIDGRFRDIAEHQARQFPVFARGQSTLGQGSFTRPSELNVDITLNIYPESDVDPSTPLIGPVVVHPGDIIVGDEDGVVCVPPDMVERVAELCAKSREIDDRCMEDIEAGKGVAETFKLHRGK